MKPITKAAFSRCGSLLLAGALAAAPALAGDRQFTIAVVPDTQHYVEYSRQKASGFPFDASEQFLEQLRYIAAHVPAEGGDVAFVSAVGDVWQNQSEAVDPAHAARGIGPVTPPPEAHVDAPTDQVFKVEMPMAAQGYRLIAGKVPFAVVPGNHDYDAAWPVEPPKGADGKPRTSFMIHVGGLDNFRKVFAADSEFFRGKPWYVASHDGGADSAQVFSAGGYRFLHIGLQFGAPSGSLRWAQQVIRRYPGVPTIITTHDFLFYDGRRVPNPIMDPGSVDPQDNNPEDLWRKLIAANDQVFLVLSGHERGQAHRADRNARGHMVYQVMADYQDRGQSGIDAGLKPGIASWTGDGWMRLMQFDMRGRVPSVHVRTYSTLYKAFSSDLPNYAAWYRPHEQPAMSDADFLKAEDFTIALTDFRQRFDRRAGERPRR